LNKDGTTRQIPLEEGVQRRIVQDALEGKIPALRKVLTWIVEREKWLLKNQPKNTKAKSSLSFSWESDSADEAMLLLDMITRHPMFAEEDKKLLIGREQSVWRALKPWVVEFGLKKLKGKARLTKEQRDDIERCSIKDGCWELPKEKSE
jgi:hypothetical protein